MRYLAATVLCLLLALPCGAQENAGEERALIGELIEQLGSQVWREREQAQKGLEKIGEPALDRLRDAAKSDDPERSSRAQAIIKGIEEAIAERKVEKLAQDALQALRPVRDVNDVEKELFRRIARAVVDALSNDKAPVAKPRKLLETEPEKKEMAIGKIGVAWTPQDSTAPARQLNTYRYSYADTVNTMLMLAVAGESTPVQKARLAFQVVQPAGEDVVRRLLEFSGSEDVSLRLTSIMKLCESAGEDYRTYFLQWLSDTEPAVREYAAGALSRLELGDSVPEALGKALKDKDYRVRYHSARAVGKSADAGAADMLLPMLEDKSPSVRAAVAGALSTSPSEKVREALVKTLEDESEYVIAVAASSLGKLRDSKALDAVAALLESQSLTVKNAAIQAIAGIGVGKYADKLVEIGSDTGQTWYVISALKECRDPLTCQVLEKILAALKDKQNAEYFRATILEAMTRYDEEKTRGQVLGLFRDEETDARFKYQLIRLLKISPDNATVEALIGQLDSQDMNLQVQSLRTLRYLTARELDQVGAGVVTGKKQGEEMKAQWLEWWEGAKGSFSIAEAAAARLEKAAELLAQAQKLFSEGKYQEARNTAVAARQMEEGRKETEDIIRKTGLLQSIEREMKMQGNLKKR